MTTAAREETLLAELRERTGLGPLAQDDEPHPGGDDRYAIYSVIAAPHEDRPGRREIARTSRDGLGLTLCTLHEEGQLTNDSRVGILDRQEHVWIINPWGKGTA